VFDRKSFVQVVQQAVVDGDGLSRVAVLCTRLHMNLQRAIVGVVVRRETLSHWDGRLGGREWND
jgi:hypothetical protein